MIVSLITKPTLPKATAFHWTNKRAGRTLPRPRLEVLGAVHFDSSSVAVPISGPLNDVLSLTQDLHLFSLKGRHFLHGHQLRSVATLHRSVDRQFNIQLISRQQSYIWLVSAPGQPS